MREYVNIRLDKDIYDGLGLLVVTLQALPEYRAVKLSNTRVAQMALIRGIAALDEDAKARLKSAGRPSPGKRAKGGK